jgi:protein-tyrosine sulfotransferase
MTDSHPTDPIFIHGILARSGTNFLWDLLLLHPDCGRGREPVNEDMFLEHSDHLVAFADEVRASWDPAWGTFAADLPGRLREGLGEGLLAFLWTDRDRRLVTKSPTVTNLDRFFQFFPRARLLILIRDGRSVVQSATDTFGWDFDRACRAWARGADTIADFQRSVSALATRWRIVRYEDLIDNMEGELRAIFDFLQLDAARYDFEAARHLPVRGSSAFGRKSDKVHWDAVPRDQSFAPKERWRSWSRVQLERFEWLAGRQMAQLGYPTSSSAMSPAGSVRHTLQDWRWHAARNARRALRHLARRSKPFVHRARRG